MQWVYDHLRRCKARYLFCITIMKYEYKRNVLRGKLRLNHTAFVNFNTVIKKLQNSVLKAKIYVNALIHLYEKFKI